MSENKNIMVELMEKHAKKSRYEIHNQDLEQYKKENNMITMKEDCEFLHRELSVYDDSIAKELPWKSNWKKEELAERASQLSFMLDKVTNNVSRETEEYESTNETIKIKERLKELFKSQQTSLTYNGKEVINILLPPTYKSVSIELKYMFDTEFDNYGDFRKWVYSQDDKMLSMSFDIWEDSWSKINISPDKWESNAGKLNKEIDPVYKIEITDLEGIKEKYKPKAIEDEDEE